MSYGEKDEKGNFKKAKYFYRSALANAIKNNQIKAIELIIEYIVRYQNNYTSSFLFKNTITRKRIYFVSIQIFKSKVFCWFLALKIDTTYELNSILLNSGMI